MDARDLEKRILEQEDSARLRRAQLSARQLLAYEWNSGVLAGLRIARDELRLSETARRRAR